MAFSYGYTGVSFFFLLSGFVLTWSCAGQPAQRFWWNRFARIWPLMALMMLTDYLFWVRIGRPAGPAGWPLQVILAQSWSPDAGTHSGGNGGTWSLSCEMFFYALFPLIVPRVQRLGRSGVLLAVAGTVLALATVPALVLPHLHNSNTSDWLFFYLPGYRMGEFLIGMLLARAVQLGLRVSRPSAGYLVATAGLAGWTWLITQAAVRNHDTGLARPWVALTALPFLVLLVLSAASADIAGTGPAARPAGAGHARRVVVRVLHGAGPGHGGRLRPSLDVGGRPPRRGHRPAALHSRRHRGGRPGQRLDREAGRALAAAAPAARRGREGGWLAPGGAGNGARSRPRPGPGAGPEACSSAGCGAGDGARDDGGAGAGGRCSPPVGITGGCRLGAGHRMFTCVL